MTLAQPTAGSPLNSPDHSALHRIIAADAAANPKTIRVNSDGSVDISDNNDTTNYVHVRANGIHQSFGSACVWDDLRLDATATRNGPIAPTDETGFRGNSSFLSRNFVHTHRPMRFSSTRNFHTLFCSAVRFFRTSILPHGHRSPGTMQCALSSNTSGQISTGLFQRPQRPLLSWRRPGQVISSGSTCSPRGTRTWEYQLSGRTSRR